jgi:hypothetical protein
MFQLLPPLGGWKADSSKIWDLVPLFRENEWLKPNFSSDSKSKSIHLKVEAIKTWGKLNWVSNFG